MFLTNRGYMAPEYIIEGHLSTKTDVFGFGLLVLETISGQRNYKHYPMTDENFVQYVSFRLFSSSSDHHHFVSLVYIFILRLYLCCTVADLEKLVKRKECIYN